MQRVAGAGWHPEQSLISPCRPAEAVGAPGTGSLWETWFLSWGWHYLAAWPWQALSVLSPLTFPS